MSHNERENTVDSYKVTTPVDSDEKAKNIEQQSWCKVMEKYPHSGNLNPLY